MGKLYAAHVINDLWRCTGGNATLVTDVGQHQMWAAQYYWMDQPNKLPLVMPDTLPMELQLLKDGYVQVLVGQRPYEMGQKAMDLLLALKKGEKVPVVTSVGLDVVTKDNVDKFLTASK